MDTRSHRIATRASRRFASRVTFSGPHDSVKDHLETSGTDAVYFRAEIPNPEFDPETSVMMVRGKPVYFEKPTITVAYLTISLDARKGQYTVGQAWTKDSFRRQGTISHLYDMAFKYAKRKGKEFGSGWIKAPEMARYWERLEHQGKAEPVEDEFSRHNVGGKGWIRTRL